jgi:capsular polysaccharide biosynthesis protein
MAVIKESQNQFSHSICKGQMAVLFPRLRAAKNFVGRCVRTKLHGIYVRQRLRRAGLDGQTLEPTGFTTAAGLFAERASAEATAVKPKRHRARQSPNRWIIYPASTEDFPLPQTIEADDVGGFSKFRGYRHPPALVYRLANAFYHGDFGAVVDTKQRVLRDLLDAPASFAQPFRAKSEPRFCDGDALVLSSSRNHYHWLIKMLPRLHLVEQAGLSASHFRKLLINWPTGAHSEAYALADIPAGALQVVREQDFWVCRNLYVSTIPHHPPGWAVEYLRRIFAPALRNVADKAKAIYLSRGETPWRRVRNEEEVIAHLARSGIESFDLSQHTFRDQIGIISNADVIISVHGAALANLVFGTRGARVLEIFASAENQKCYRAIAAHRQMTYHYFLAQQIPAEREPNQLDLVIPLEKLDRAADIILAS